MFDIDAFEKMWETEYLCDRIKRVTEDVRAGRYESALDYLHMLQDKSRVAAYLITQQKSK
ncbi:hypothetical protein [Desulfitobacterium sp. AusDCA]|uniref:hypothetical protein n=1 Tax=Desulfitobacterium sp. AusDCA TaxID=3240383 RepID=UPI003DA713E6